MRHKQGGHRAFADEENTLGAAAAHAHDAAEAEGVKMRLKSKFRGVQVTLMTGGGVGVLAKQCWARMRRGNRSKGHGVHMCSGGLGRRSYTDVGPQRQGGRQGKGGVGVTQRRCAPLAGDHSRRATICKLHRTATGVNRKAATAVAVPPLPALFVDAVRLGR
jgi:hypothetical protein